MQLPTCGSMYDAKYGISINDLLKTLFMLGGFEHAKVPGQVTSLHDVGLHLHFTFKLWVWFHVET
jgi:hypothetical protein